MVLGYPIFSYGKNILPKNSPDCHITCNWVFDNFILAEEPFPKALQSLETCVLVNNNLYGKLFSPLESPATFKEILKLLQYHFLFQILVY